MTTEEWNKAMNHLAPDIIEAYVEENNKRKEQRRSKTVRLRICAAVACFALAVGAFLVPLGWGDGFGISGMREVPVWEDALFSAEAIGVMMRQETLGSTNLYQKVYVPNEQFLKIQELGEEQFLDIYQINEMPRELNREEFHAWRDEIFSKLFDALGEESSSSNSKEYDYSISDTFYTESYRVSFSQVKWHKHISLSSNKEDRSISLEGERIEIDQRMSDEEIIDALSSVKSKLLAILGVSFPDAKVTRLFDSTSKHGAFSINIYFYDRSKLPESAYWSYLDQDYLCLSFHNRIGAPGDFVSDGVLTDCDIDLFQRREEEGSMFTVFGQGRRISLEDAENLLNHGYVFGGHYCLRCMLSQEKVNFEDYDFVKLTYSMGRDPGTNRYSIALPFYVFYKRIGTAENGNAIYACADVCAIELSGYQEYFLNQFKEH